MYSSMFMSSLRDSMHISVAWLSYLQLCATRPFALRLATWTSATCCPGPEKKNVNALAHLCIPTTLE